MGKNLSQMIDAIRQDLKDSNETVYWTESELARSVQRAVADLSRFIPLEQTYEATLLFDVTGESFTSAAAHGTYVSLASKPIKESSETVTNVAGSVTYTRDTDYTIDYSNGKITTISGGSMVVSTTYKISYTKSKISIDLTSLTGLIRVDRVEYPVGQVPQFVLAPQIVQVPHW